MEAVRPGLTRYDAVKSVVLLGIVLSSARADVDQMWVEAIQHFFTTLYNIMLLKAFRYVCCTIRDSATDQFYFPLPTSSELTLMASIERIAGF